jgi:cytochrome c-type biogenesis protein CcmH
VRRWRLLLAGCGLFASVAVFAQQDLSDLNPDQADRYDTLIHELRCLVCQNQTIADSSAPLAIDLREQVHKQIASGRSDKEIRGYLTDRYGDFVLYKPPFAWRTAILWLGPFALALGALAAVLSFTRRSRASRAPVAADPEALKRLLDEDSKRS